MKKLLIYFILLSISMGCVYEKDAQSNKTKKISDENKQIIKEDNKKYTVYKPDLEKNEIKMHWLSDKGQPYKQIKNLLESPSNEDIIFAMNGGIYTTDCEPEGLYLENNEMKTKVNYDDGKGNFYLKPNGVFMIKDNKSKIINTIKYKHNEDISYAVQSGPLLIEKGKPKGNFTEKSTSKKIRNAVGINNDNEVFFYISNEEVTFYDFTQYALKELDCKDLLYLDGTISKMYIKGEKEDINQKREFVTMITVERKK